MTAGADDSDRTQGSLLTLGREDETLSEEQRGDDAKERFSC